MRKKNIKNVNFKIMLKNVSNGWLTTLGGIVLLIIAGLGIIGKLSSDQVEGLSEYWNSIVEIIAGILLLFAKDPNQEE
jgi:hypothetical protein